MNSDNERRPLWAPWRIEYIRQTKDGDGSCFFCRDAAQPESDDENFVLCRGQKVFALLNRYPYNPGHILIAPYRHLADLDQLDAEERIELFDLLIRCENALKRAMAPQAFNVGCNLGHAAGAAIRDHVHFHLVPRWHGDTNFMPIVAHTDCLPQALDEAAQLLRDQLAADDAP